MIAEDTIDTLLADYGTLIDRHDLAAILGVTYQYVPKELKRLGIPTLATEGNWSRIKIHKEVLKSVLLDHYNKNEGDDVNE